MITIKGHFTILFISVSFISILVIGALYLHTTSSPAQANVLFQIPTIEKHSNQVQIASSELVLPLSGQYSVKMKGKAELYIQTGSKVYKNPQEIELKNDRIIRVILLNQSSDVYIEFHHRETPNYRLPILILTIGGVAALAVRMLKFE